MGSINAINTSIDQTVQIFDRFYSYRGSVPAQEYDVVYSYFLSVFATTEQAANFSATLFRISDASGIYALTLLSQLQGLSAPEMTLQFAFYLNTLQSPSAMLGINTPLVPNYYVARNIRI